MAVPVAFLDSGIGGIPYLVSARALLPQHRYLYIADTRHFPYGEKSAAEIRAAAVQAVERVLKVSPVGAVVVACNTASVVALDELRAQFEIPFVGVVPAVKPAAASSASRRIGVLATPRTAQGDYLQALIQRFATGAEVVVRAAPELVDFVEHRLPDAGTEERREVLRAHLGSLLDAGVDRVVLGCTHFIHLRSEIESLVGPEIQVVDSVDGVTKQLARVLRGGAEGASPSSGERSGGDRSDADNEGRGSGEDALYVTSGSRAPAQYRSMAESVGLRYAGELAS